MVQKNSRLVHYIIIEKLTVELMKCSEAYNNQITQLFGFLTTVLSLNVSEIELKEKTY